MSLDANKELGRGFFEAQDRLNGGPDLALCAPTYTAHIGSNPPMTRAHHEGFATAFYAAFPDLWHTVDEIAAEDDRVVVRLTIRGTHSANFMGIPTTNKAIEVGLIAILHVANGKVVELRAQFDQMGMMRQPGVIQ